MFRCTPHPGHESARLSDDATQSGTEHAHTSVSRGLRRHSPDSETVHSRQHRHVPDSMQTLQAQCTTAPTQRSQLRHRTHFRNGAHPSVGLSATLGAVAMLRRPVSASSPSSSKAPLAGHSGSLVTVTEARTSPPRPPVYQRSGGLDLWGLPEVNDNCVTSYLSHW